MDFPAELAILTYLTILMATLWVPYIIGVNTVPVGTLPENAPDGFILPPNWRLHRPWVQRAYRAHMNLLEQFVPFAAVVLILDRMGGFNAVTYWTCVAFFWLRGAHAVGYITAWTRFPLRPLIFTGGWICVLILASQVFLGR